jgi:septum formation topological specificity factor MinE
MELKPMMKTEILTVIQPHVEENLNEIVEKYKMSEEEAAILYTEVVGLIGQLEE